MKIIKQFELFQYDIDLQIITQNENEFKVEFEINSDIYFFQARKEDILFPEEKWEIENKLRGGWHLGFGIGEDKNKYLLTNKGNQFKVFSAVKKSLDLFEKLYKPKRLSFISEGDTKSKIYLSFFKDHKVEKENIDLPSLSGKTPYLYKITKK